MAGGRVIVLRRVIAGWTSYTMSDRWVSKNELFYVFFKFTDPCYGVNSQLFPWCTPYLKQMFLQNVFVTSRFFKNRNVNSQFRVKMS